MLPKIVYPTFTIEQPSTKKKLLFRRFLVKEEKILLLAKETKEVDDVFRAIKSVVKVCCQEKNLNVEKLPLFDLEYIYLQLRAASVNNIEKFSVRDKDDGMVYPLLINFDEIKVQFKEDAPTNKIKIDDNIILLMKYPEASIYDDSEFKTRIAKEGLFELVINCVESIFNKDEQLTLTKSELSEFVDNLDVKTYKHIEAFLLGTPALKYELRYINSLGVEKTLYFNSLMDFFLYL